MGVRAGLRPRWDGAVQGRRRVGRGVVAQMVRRASFWQQVGVRRADAAVTAQIGALLLVVITVVLTVVVGLFATGLVRLPEEAPTMGCVGSRACDRWNTWSIQIEDVSETLPISQYRVIVDHPNGTRVMYDTDGDLRPDEPLVAGLESLVVSGADVPHTAPVVFIDQDLDGRVGPADTIVVFGTYFALAGPLLDATRGYKPVDRAPAGIPIESQMLIVVCEDTLPGSAASPGDRVVVTLDKGGPFEVVREGYVSGSGYFTSMVSISGDWQPAQYMQTTFTLRPGEVDEWSANIPFKVRMHEHISPERRAFFDNATSPMRPGDVIAVVHEASDTVVMRYTL